MTKETIQDYIKTLERIRDLNMYRNRRLTVHIRESWGRCEDGLWNKQYDTLYTYSLVKIDCYFMKLERVIERLHTIRWILNHKEKPQLFSYNSNYAIVHKVTEILELINQWIQYHEDSEEIYKAYSPHWYNLPIHGKHEEFLREELEQWYKVRFELLDLVKSIREELKQSLTFCDTGIDDSEESLEGNPHESEQVC